MASGPGDLLGLIFALSTSLSVIVKFESFEPSCKSVRTGSWASPSLTKTLATYAFITLAVDLSFVFREPLSA